MRLNRIGVEVGEIGWHWETIKLVVEALQGRSLGSLKREEMVGLVGELVTFSLPTTTGALVKGGIQREVESWQDSVFAPPPLAPIFTIQFRTTKIQPVTLWAAHVCQSVTFSVCLSFHLSVFLSSIVILGH